MRTARRRKGFTLPEVLVTLAIVATLAAVLLPALNQQLSKGDAGRLASDLTSLQTAIGAFTSDVRRFPLNQTQLSTGITGSVTDLDGVDYPATLEARWRGPYLSKSLVSGALPSAFGATITPTFSKQTLSSNSYLAIDFSPITEADFNKVDLILDEAAASTTGQLQMISATGARFFAVPTQ